MDPSHKSLFPVFDKYPKLAYLDNAATTQRPKSVIAAMNDFYAYENANIHRGIYQLSNDATQKYEDVRYKVARFLGVENAETIGFTKGTTESVNVVANSFLAHRLTTSQNIVTTMMEHHANFLPWQELAKQKNVELRLVAVDANGDLDIEQLRELLTEETGLLAINHISNTLGTVNDIRSIIELAHERAVPVLVDAAQSAAYYDLNLSDLHADFLVFSGHKLFGPFGIGVLYVAEKWIKYMLPYNYGGGMITRVGSHHSSYRNFPYNLEAGTSNVGGVIGLGAAIDFIQTLDSVKLRNEIKSLTVHTREQLSQLEGLHLVGNPQNQSGIVSFTIDEVHPHDIAAHLNRDDIAVRAGMHCTQPLLDGFGIPATVRASFSIYNTKEEIDRLYHSLEELIDFWK